QRNNGRKHPFGQSATRAHGILPPVNVERTIEFILESQAKTEIRLTGITKLMQQGMKMLVKVDSDLAQLTTTVAQLAEAQKRTDARLAEGQRRTDANFSELSQEMKELAKVQNETQRMFQAFMRDQPNGRSGR